MGPASRSQMSVVPTVVSCLAIMLSSSRCVPVHSFVHDRRIVVPVAPHGRSRRARNTSRVGRETPGGSYGHFPRARPRDTTAGPTSPRRTSTVDRARGCGIRRRWSRRLVELFASTDSRIWPPAERAFFAAASARPPAFLPRWPSRPCAWAPPDRSACRAAPNHALCAGRLAPRGGCCIVPFRGPRSAGFPEFALSRTPGLCYRCGVIRLLFGMLKVAFATATVNGRGHTSAPAFRRAPESPR